MKGVAVSVVARPEQGSGHRLNVAVDRKGRCLSDECLCLASEFDRFNPGNEARKTLGGWNNSGWMVNLRIDDLNVRMNRWLDHGLHVSLDHLKRLRVQPDPEVAKFCNVRPRVVKFNFEFVKIRAVHVHVWCEGE